MLNVGQIIKKKFIKTTIGYQKIPTINDGITNNQKFNYEKILSASKQCCAHVKLQTIWILRV